MSERIHAHVTVSLTVSDERLPSDTLELLNEQDEFVKHDVERLIRDYFNVGQIDKLEINVKHGITADAEAAA